MLVVKCQEHLDYVRKFAAERGLTDQLQSKLDYLDTYAGRENTECHLFQDFAPYSFEFVMLRGGVRWFNGGMIYQGPDQPGDGSFPALTVSLDSSHGWTINT